MQARSELMWASAMAENGVLKLGKVTDFQCHMIEQQLGAYTDCNHGYGLAVIQPELYRHLAPEAPAQFARFAREVFGVAEQESELATALAGVEKFAAFIEEIGLPTTLKAMGIEDKAVLHAVAVTSIRTPGCVKKLTDEEIEEILLRVLG